MHVVREREREEALQRQQEEAGITSDNVGLVKKLPVWKILWYQIVYNRMYHGLILLFLFAIIVPTLFFVFLYNGDNLDDRHTCDIIPGYRIPCGVDHTDPNKCLEANCCFNYINKTCYQTLPSKYQYRSTDAEWKNGFEPVLSKTPFGGNNAGRVFLSKNDVDKDILSFTLNTKPARGGRVIDIESGDHEYEGSIYTTQMGLEVKRKNGGDVLLSTTHGPTIISDRYWEWTIDLHTDHLFGLDQLRFEDNKTTTRVIYSNSKDHGIIPKFIAENNGKYHGLYIEHAGPLEISVLPSKLIIIRMLSGLAVTFHLSLGPTPADIMLQQRVEPIIPPYWALGVHICRNGNLSSIASVIENLNSDLNEAISRSIPYDSDCLHENLFSLTMQESQDDKLITEALTTLQSKGIKFMMSLAPQIETFGPQYDEAIKKGILYKDRDSKELQGKYLKKKVVFPYYNTNATKAWLKESLLDLYSKFGINIENSNKIGGFVLKDNWPINEDAPMEGVNNFQYLSMDLKTAMSNTIPWDAKATELQEQISEHNNYGADHTTAFYDIDPSLFLLSASFNIQNPHGAHRQNVNVSWVDYKQMLTATLSHSLFGSPLHSTPICGSTDFYSEEKHESLCLRWYLTAVTLPIFRISSAHPKRDPMGIQSKSLLSAVKNSIQQRYKLMPYYYTILLKKQPLVRPMFFNFHQDANTLLLDEQYMVGDALLVVQPVLVDISILNVYLPEIPDGWFEFWGGIKYNETGWVRIPVVETDLVMFIAAGSVVPLQTINKFDATTNAEKNRQNPISLAAALNCSILPCEAFGTWGISETVSLEFNVNGDTLRVSNILKSKDKLCVENIANSEISSIRIYEDNEIKVYYLTLSDINICTSTVDVVDIKYIK